MCDQPFHCCNRDGCGCHHTSRGVSCCDDHKSEGVSCCDHHTSVPYNDATLSRAHLSFWADGTDDTGKYTKRQREMLDRSLLEEMDSEGEWYYERDADESWMECKSSHSDDPSPSPPRGDPPIPPTTLGPLQELAHRRLVALTTWQSDIMNAYNDDAASRQLALQLAQAESEASNLRTETAPAKEAARQAAAQQVLANMDGRQDWMDVKSSQSSPDDGSMDDGPKPPSPRPLPPTPAPPSAPPGAPAVAGLVPKENRGGPFPSASRTLDILNTCTSGVSQEREARPRHRSACEIVHQHVTAPPLPRFVPTSEATPPLEQSGGADQDPQLLRRSDQHPQLEGAGLIIRPSLPPPPLPQENDVRQHSSIAVVNLGSRHRRPPSLPDDDKNDYATREHSHQLLRAPQVRHMQPPPLLPAPCFSVEYFMNHVPLREHWNVHKKALRQFRQLGWNHGKKAFRMGDCQEDMTMTSQCELRDLRYQGSSWCWHDLVAQLDDQSLPKVVFGSKAASGLVACKVMEGTQVDRTRASAAEKPPFSTRKEVQYKWEFALLRDNGTIAFLRPQDRTTTVEYYEGLPKSAVATPPGDFLPVYCAKSFRPVSCAFDAGPIEKYFIPDKARTDDDNPLNHYFVTEQDRSADACSFGGTKGTHEEVVFPSSDSLILTEVELLHFLTFHRCNHDRRGSATRPPKVHAPRP